MTDDTRDDGGFEAFCGAVGACRLCESRFAETVTGHEPRPVVWLSRSAPVLIVGQAPGARVHNSGIPFDDPSGDRLRGWLGVDRAAFYDRGRFAIMPMAFCFPGYDGKGSDLPPPALCARTWHEEALARMPSVRLTLLVGGYAQRWLIRREGGAAPVTETVRNWKRFGPGVIPLPHPSWRNTGWLRKNPWFETEVLPELRCRVAEALMRTEDENNAA